MAEAAQARRRRQHKRDNPQSRRVGHKKMAEAAQARQPSNPTQNHTGALALRPLQRRLRGALVLYMVPRQPKCEQQGVRKEKKRGERKKRLEMASNSRLGLRGMPEWMCPLN